MGEKEPYDPTAKKKNESKDFGKSPIRVLSKPLTSKKITLEQGIELFQYPYVIGEHEGEDIQVCKRDNVFLKWKGKYATVYQEAELNLQKAIELLTQDKKSSKYERVLQEKIGKKRKYMIAKNSRGYYIMTPKVKGKGMDFGTFPKDKEVETITLEEVQDFGNLYSR